MNLRQVARLLAGFILFFSIAMSVPLVFSFGDDDEFATTTGFAAGLISGLVLALGLWLAGRGSDKQMFRREGLVVVGAAWLLAAVLASVPFVVSGAIEAPVDALFESVSGLTTTGATVLGGSHPTIESLPMSILLWRTLMQWMGGIGIILVFIVLLPGMGVVGSRLLTSEEIGVSSEDVRPRMLAKARVLFALYSALTAAAATGYWLAGMSVFDAVCHAFTTLGTAGFSNNDASIGGYDSLGIELVAIAFMFLAGCNFLLMVQTLSRWFGSKKKLPLLHLAEFRVYAILTLGIVVAMTFVLWAWGRPVVDDAVGLTRDYSDFGRCARDAAFQTVSILTSTGYATADFQVWPKTALYVLMMCMLVGGCTGSTSGGFKVLRAAVCAGLLRHSLRHFTRPRVVEKLRVSHNVIPDHIISAILTLLLLWFVTVAVGTVVLSFDSRLGVVSAFSASLSMTCCTGPAITEVVPAATAGTFETVGSVAVGPSDHYGDLHTGSKLFMSLQMILGRLEILAPLTLLTPGFWKRR